jgi:alpha-N-arabinofuranosidase
MIMQMKIFKFAGFSLVILFILSPFVIAQQPVEITLQAGKPVCDIQPTMWGVFFEDINFAADGGIYAELVKNRSFEFSLPLMGWKQESRDKCKGRVLPTFYSPPNDANPHFVTIIVETEKGSFGLSNEGFRGMGIQQDNIYNFSVLARSPGNSDIKMKVELRTPDGSYLGGTEISGFTAEWRKYETSIKALATEPKAHLLIMFSGLGSADIDMVSLFPADTWKGRPGGLRKDIVGMIADLKPGFIRFPGGCIVEGRNIINRYQWKNTIGPVESRKLIMNRWNVEMKNRPAPDYFQSFGLGFFEYFQLAEDLGAEPLPILNCGMSCQFNAGEVVPLDELDQYIQDALDLIEFANGPANTLWGKVRSSLGHPKPFNMKYIGIGNEQWEEQYIERYKMFEKVLKEKHPEIKIVSGSGPSPDGDYFDFAWQELRNLSPALIDEHYYRPPEWFLNNAGRYDSYDRKGIKVFAGEYAAHSRESAAAESRNSWLSALSEAAFMTGLERNAAVVQMASYAPLLAHVDAWQWRPDLIWFDNLNCIGTPNYYVQKLFSTHRGTVEIPIVKDGKPLTGTDSLYACASIDKPNSKVYVKIVNSSSSKRPVSINIEGMSPGKAGTIEKLKANGLYEYNSMANPKLIFPAEESIAVNSKKLPVTLEPRSVNVITLDYRK